ncbi:MAG: 30S ribosomal protein S8 [Alphaproteobacteria bacterium]|jgi:small subunit ribosomal protein S8|nr:30S ribosomal protein S8 [Alphaproteobacteria bacterium]
MTMTDPIADMLTRIRNCQMVGKETVSMPASKVKNSILAVMKEEGYIADFVESGEGTEKEIKVTLKYFDAKPVITEIRRKSKPGLRSYKSASDVPLVRNGLGLAIISTSGGMMSDAKARALGVGGELICEMF